MSRAGGCLPLLGSLVGGAVGTRTTLKTCMGLKVNPHVSMNSSTGVISCGELLNDTTEEITKDLKSQEVTHFEKEVIVVKVQQQVSYLEAKKIVQGRTPLPGNSYVSKLKNTVDPKRNQTLPTDTSLDSVQIAPSTAPIQEQDLIPICKGSDSHDVSGFTIVKKKTADKRSTSLKDAENKTNSIVASKFWRTSPLENSTPTSVQGSYSRESIIKADGATVNDHDKLTSTVNSGPAPMAIDNKLLDSPKTDIEPDNVTEYNPNETIDEISLVLAQQPSTSATTTDTNTLKQRFKKCPLRWVDIDFKTFYSEPLSTPIHDKYLKNTKLKGFK
ncbi:hypothetical protein AVEN_233040-1 [Araneus ventricosus]|uniref:Uncharacterized protein n=1 Tax=Araneus ventricosus TaxID=182803 RepID=A0A4Y2PJK0_ARAVE|nr:hypothetical protein AVEN_233040-1 [Araneus ventricosus]